MTAMVEPLTEVNITTESLNRMNASMPQIRCVGRAGIAASVAANATPAAGLWPPSSHSSISGTCSTSRPLRSRCIRAGQSAFVTAASKAASPSPRCRSAATAAPAFST